jgi:hypothetical protein
MKKGHMARDCPDRIEKFTVNVVQAAQKEDEETECESSFLAATLADCVEGGIQLFGDNEVLLYPYPK